MKYEEIKNAIHSIHAGTYANMTTCKTLKTRKEFKDKNIVKISRSTIRSGCDYENLKSLNKGVQMVLCRHRIPDFLMGHGFLDKKNTLLSIKGISILESRTAPTRAV